MAHPRAGLARKAAIVKEIADRLARSQGVILTDFRGLDVATMQRLRRRLREAGADCMVAKNTLIRRALAGAGTQAPDGFLAGPTALCFIYQEPVSAARALVEFGRENPALQVKGGWLLGRALSAQDVQALAQLPPREVLIARVLGGMQAPLSSLLFVLTGAVRKLALVLEAIRQQKEQAVSGQPAPS